MMDALVARYSRPAFNRTPYFDEEDEDYCNPSMPSLSLKFALPPVANVSIVMIPCSLSTDDD